MILFFLGLILLAIDISRRTLPPGSRKKTSTVIQTNTNTDGLSPKTTAHRVECKATAGALASHEAAAIFDTD